MFSFILFSYVLHFGLILTAGEYLSDVFMGLAMINIKYL